MGTTKIEQEEVVVTNSTYESFARKSKNTDSTGETCAGCKYNLSDHNVNNYGQQCDRNGGPGDPCYTWTEPDSGIRSRWEENDSVNGLKFHSIW